MPVFKGGLSSGDRLIAADGVELDAEPTGGGMSTNQRLDATRAAETKTLVVGGSASLHCTFLTVTPTSELGRCRWDAFDAAGDTVFEVEDLILAGVGPRRWAM